MNPGGSKLAAKPPAGYASQPRATARSPALLIAEYQGAAGSARDHRDAYAVLLGAGLMASGDAAPGSGRIRLSAPVRD